MLLAGELVIPVKAIMVGVAFKKLMKAGGGLVVSVLALYTDDHRSNPT